jgi:SAM-dependent methyltransferase
MSAHRADALGVTSPSAFSDRKRVLNGGSGPQSGTSLHAIFKNGGWSEVRLDINPATVPDVIGSITNMRASFSSASFDAVWSSHSLEHLDSYEVPAALREFRRVLKPDGFALITCPDLESVVAALLEHGPDHVSYVSAIGPITSLDMLFGHSGSIAAGNRHMSHRTGFTAGRLGNLLLGAGFVTALTRSVGFDLWALALMDRTDQSAIIRQFRAASFTLFDVQH